MEGLDALLQGLRSDGRVDSEGSFTLDPAVALRKLQNSLSAEPHLAILKAVQIAVRTGTKVHVATRRDGLTLSFSETFELDRHPDNPYELLIPRAESNPLRNHLAGMLLGFLALTDGRIELPFRTPSGLFLLTLEKGHAGIASIGRPRPASVDLSRKDQMLMLDLMKRCDPSRIPPAAALGQLDGPSEWGELHVELPSGVLCVRVNETVMPASNRSCQALVGFTPDGRDGRLRIVQDGVIVETLSGLLGVGQFAFLCASDLPTDLGGFIVRRDLLAPRVELVGQALWRLRDQMALHFEYLPRRWTVARLYLTKRYGSEQRPPRGAQRLDPQSILGDAPRQ